MATDYEKISAENEKNALQMLHQATEALADNYSDETHFIFELLQNAEDELGQINAKSYKVELTLQENKFTISHYGKPFNEKDVKRISNICQSAKARNPNTTGEHGIGFKSVFNFTTTPHIFSGDENFKIKNYTVCFAERPDNLVEGETRIILPFDKPNKKDAFGIIKEGLEKFRRHHFLFLRHIKTLKWRAIKEDKEDVVCITIKKEKEWGDFARRVIITSTNPQDEEKTWIIFSKGEGKKRVEIAFLQDSGKTPNDWKLTKREGDNALYCLFPTEKETHLKFLVQGKFKTTKSRENIEKKHPRNKYLIKCAGDLLIEILLLLKKEKKLDWDVLKCLPIEWEFFHTERLFSPMAEKMCKALKSEKLLPTNGGFIEAKNAKIPTPDKLRELFNDKMISKLFRKEGLRWLKAGSGDMKDFLNNELDIKSVRLSDIMKEKDIIKVLKQQSDNWIQKLYALLLKDDFDVIKTLPLIRLENGKHISSHDPDGKAQVYLSSTRQHSNIIKPETIKTKEAKDFMEKLGIETHDDTDDLINEMQERYPQSDNPDFFLSKEKYNNDIKRIVAIQNNDKIDKEKKKKFSDELKRIRFVKAKNMKTDERKVAWKCPEEVYIATENLETLFSGVDAYLVHDDLKKDNIREMLVHYGAKDCLQPIEIDECHLLKSEEKEIFLKSNRKNRSNMRPRSYTQGPRIVNYNIKYLDAILASFFRVSKENQKNKAKALWDTLAISHSKINKQFRAKNYYTYEEEIEYDAKFISNLNKEEWIPAPDGALKRPEFVVFEDLGWDDDELLREHIIFKLSDLDEKRRAVGLSEDGHRKGRTYQEILEKKNNGLSLTAAEEGLLKANEAVEYERSKNSQPSPEEIPLEETDAPKEESQDALVEDYVLDEDVEISVIFHRPYLPDDTPTLPDISESQSGIYKKRTTLPPSPSPDYSDQMNQDDVVARTRIEKAAIAVVLRKYPNWKDANIDHPNNPGYDLYELDEEGNQCRWIEVKGLAGEHTGKPKMSDTQRGFALGLKAAGKEDQYTHITVAYADTKTPQVIRYDNPTAEPHRLVGDDDD